MQATEEISRKKHMIALYYCYPPAGLPKDKLELHKLFHQETCTNLTLGGRIRVSEEGINGVLSGTEDALREYEASLRKELLQLVVNLDDDLIETTAGCNDDNNNDPTAEWLDIKYCHLRNDIPMEKQLFDSLQVKITREVVSLIEPTPQNQGKNKGKRCRQRRKQKRKEKQMQEKLAEASVGEDESSKDTDKVAAANEALTIEDWKNNTPAQHLSPEEWNEKLLELAQQEEEGSSFEKREAVLLDTRNIYETRVGHFGVPNLKTVFPNTRKFSSLPLALNTEEAAEALAGKDVFMYCTGGVRCERAGTYLRALSDSNSGAWQGKEKPKAIYQLKGGIQKYLETYGEQTESKADDDDNAKQCLYRGKNFVFDQRRTDPVIGKGITSKAASDSSERVSSVGQCIICSKTHDDYDNGFSPCDEKEARCCRCRVLVLVCNECRPKVRSCGEPEADNATDLLCGRTSCIDEGNVAGNVETIRF